MNDDRFAEFDPWTVPDFDHIRAAGAVSGANLDAARAGARGVLLDHIAQCLPDDGAERRVSAHVQSRGRRKHPWARRGLAVAAAVTLLAASQFALQTVRPGAARGSVAFAADGSVTCPGSGYAHPIKPADADARLLPATLPAGWSIDRIFARWEVSDSSAACTRPSLTVVRIGSDEVVTGQAQVFGPFRAVDTDSFLGDRAAVRIDGEPGLHLTMTGTDFNRWVWTDGDQSWLMESEGFGSADAVALVDAVHTEGSSVSWDAAAAPAGTEVTHLRDSAPYAYQPAAVSWYLRLRGPHGQGLAVDASFSPEHAVGILEQPSVGTRLLADGSARTESSTEEGYSVSIQRDDGWQISGWNEAQWESGQMSKRSSAAVLEDVLAALVNVPADDPRLSKYALDEPTVEHP